MDSLRRLSARAVRIFQFLIVGIAFSLMLLLGGIVLAAHASGPNESGVFRRSVLIVESGSMSPSVKTGDVVVVKNLSASARAVLLTGDVVTFKAANNDMKLITHRIVAVRHLPNGETFYTTKGDANEIEDSALLTPDRVIGKVEFRVPRLGFAIDSFDKPEVAIRLIASLALFAFAAFMFRLSREIGRKIPPDSQPVDPPKRKVQK